MANDINTARARALLRNLELFGISNSFVTNEPPHVLAERFPEFFHKIMVDAPCSGEGMFRKNPAGGFLAGKRTGIFFKTAAGNHCTGGRYAASRRHDVLFYLYIFTIGK